MNKDTENLNLNELEKNILSINADVKKPFVFSSLFSSWNMKSKKIRVDYINFKRKHSYVFFLFRKILSSILVAFVVYIIFFVLLRISVSNNILLNGIPGYDEFIANHGTNSHEYQKLLNDRLNQLGLDGNIFSQVFRNIYYILPFKKTILSNPTSIDSDGTLIGVKSLVVFSYFGEVIHSQNHSLDNLTSILNSKTGKTIFLSIISTFFSYIIGAPLAILASSKKDKKIDKGIRVLGIFLKTSPPLVLIMITLVITKVFLKVPETGLAFYLGPLIFMVLSQIPIVFFGTRALIINEVSSSYVNYLSAKGFSESQIFFKHILKNAILKILKTILFVFIISLFGTSLFAEYAWGYDGLNLYLVNAIKHNEIFIVNGYVVISIEIVLFFYLINDLILTSLEMRYS